MFSLKKILKKKENVDMTLNLYKKPQNNKIYGMVRSVHTIIHVRIK